MFSEKSFVDARRPTQLANKMAIFQGFISKEAGIRVIVDEVNWIVMGAQML